jgi:2-methylcitrate dehydratase PrpD
LFATFGSAYLAGKLLGLNTTETASAAGIAGSFAGGLLECWVDGTQTKFLHPGWSGQSGIVAALWPAPAPPDPLKYLKDAGASSRHMYRIKTHTGISAVYARDWASIGRAAIHPSNRFPPPM